MMGVKGQRVVILGLGRSGRSAARLAAHLGAREILGVDQRLPDPPIASLHQAREELSEGWLDAQTRVIVSPGIPAGHPWIQRSLACGAHVQGELAFAAEHLRVPLIAVTGTNGKSTVTHLTGQLLTACGRNPFVGGNIGVPLSEGLLAEEAFDVVVAEVSSYQLEWSQGLRPAAAVILNLTPDHLARHGTMEGYALAKLKIFDGLGPDGLGVLPDGESHLQSGQEVLGDRTAWLGGLPGLRLEEGGASLQLPGEGVQSIALDRLPLPGRHNQLNAGVAILLAHAVGVPLDSLQANVGGLSGLPHRMEVIGTFEDVCWINDSKATNLDAAEVAIRGVPQPSVVLLGGKAKGRGFSALVPWLERHRAVVTFGASGDDVADELGAAGYATHRATNLEDAVRVARSLARAGDAILLSPGGASFDEFDDFEHRGRMFRGLVTGKEERCQPPL